jgi:hypothetical protein
MYSTIRLASRKRGVLELKAGNEISNFKFGNIFVSCPIILMTP